MIKITFGKFGVPPARKMSTGGFVRECIICDVTAEAVPVLNIDGNVKF
jgi:hypothetical protein